MLGQLEKVELRDIWKSESSDFTPWLAQEQNLAILGKTINLELELEAQEKNVGPFRADILCKNLEDDSWVLIENQLERTDHNHLGQLLTYAAGLHAVTIIWIAANFTDEHRATLDWLNDITDDSFRFFGLEVELWRIGDSPAAPKFNIVSKPNDWSRSITRAAKAISSGELSDVRKLYLNYWTALRAKLETSGSSLRLHGPRPQHWANISIGRSGFKLSVTASATQNWTGVELNIRDDAQQICIRQLEQEKSEVEQIIGEPLEWMDLPDKKASRILLRRENVAPSSEKQWDDQFEWIIDKLHKFDQAFRQRVRNIDPDAMEYADQPEDQEDT